MKGIPQTEQFFGKASILTWEKVHSLAANLHKVISLQEDGSFQMSAGFV
jgi:hypothetical protein